MRLRFSILAIALLAPVTALAEEPSAAAPAAAAPTADAPAAAPVVTTTPVVAPDATAPAATATAAEPAKGWKDLVTVEGLADSYYMWNFSGPTNTTAPALRNFDVNSNSFSLNYAKIGFGLSAEKAGFRVDLGYGGTGALINGAAPPLPAGEASVSPATSATAFIVQQAYASLTPVSGLSIDFGKFVTTAGAEVIESNKNWLYSRSFLFFNIPLLHNGVRAGYKVNDMISAQVSVVNGWNGTGVAPYPTGDKTFGFNLALTLPMGVAVIPTVYVGDTGSGTVRTLFDLVASYTIGALALNFNFDYVRDKNALPNPFVGGALMGHYTITEWINATLRAEVAKSDTAATATAPSQRFWYYEVTGGVAFPFSGHFELRPEIRWDGSDQAIFNAKKNQVTGTLAALAYF
jgi:hypothetical protein